MVALRSAWHGACLLTVSALLLVGCGEQSKVPADARVSITGSVLDPSGRPLTERPVRLTGGIAGADVALAAFTLGLGCFDGACRGATRDTSTDGTGGFAFSVLGRDTQSAFGSVRSQVVSSSAAPAEGQSSGAGVSAVFVVQTQAVALPPMRLVDPQLSVQGDTRRVVSRWSTRAPGPYTLTFAGADGRPTWRQATAGQALAVDGRVLEGTAGEVTLSGASRDRIPGSDVSVLWRSAGYGYSSDVGAPASRGASCTVGTQALQPCPLTDGDLIDLAPAAACPTSPQASTCPAATITLTTPAAADLLVVRGCRPSCPVQVSADGSTFGPTLIASGEYATLALDGQPVRAVRVRVGVGIREVSVWEPAKAPAALRDLPAARTVRDRSRRLLMLGVLGGLLLLGLTVAVTWQLARRAPRVR